MVREPGALPVVPLARRNFRYSAACEAPAVEPLVREPGLCLRSTPGLAMPYRDDRGTGAQLVQIRRTRDRAQRQSSRSGGGRNTKRPHIPARCASAHRGPGVRPLGRGATPELRNSLIAEVDELQREI